jgi:hypothetical protein
MNDEHVFKLKLSIGSDKPLTAMDKSEITTLIMRAITPMVGIEIISIRITY